MSRVMIVDDQVDLQQLIAATLKSGGYSPVSVFDPRRALEVAASTRPDAVILDVMMPALSGWDLLSALRTNRVTANKPILMLSSFGDSKVRAKGIRLGADDFLLKPFDPDELLARLGALLKRSGAPKSSLQGSLQDHPLSEVIQGFQNSQLRGRLEVQDPAGGGWLEIEGNRLLDAHYGRCRGAEAFLAMLPIRQGEFGFYAARPREGQTEEPPLPSDGEGWALLRLLLEAAWIDDELASRKSFLPSEETHLELLRVPERGSEELPDLHLREITDQLATAGVASLGDLLAASVSAPSRMRLAVAWLIQESFVRCFLERPPASDIDAADQEAIEAPLRELFQVAVFMGLSVTPLCVQILVDDGAWPEASRILASIPTVIPGCLALREIGRFLAEGQGELSLSTEAGQILISVVRGDGDSWEGSGSGFKPGISVVWCRPETLRQGGERWRSLVQGMSDSANKLLICSQEVTTEPFQAWPSKTPPDSLQGLLDRLLETWS